MKKYNTITESKIIWGDCLEVMDRLPAYAFSLILTDPPYLFTKKNGKDVTGEGRRFSRSPLYDYRESEEICLLKMRYGRDEVYAWLDKTPRLMRKYNAYIFCSEEQIGIYQDWAHKHEYKSSVLVWEKPVSIISKQRWSQNVEYIMRIYENGTGLNKIADSSYYSRVLRYPTLHKKEHPTQKPLELVTHLLNINSTFGDAVLDPFLGSGTTYVAARRMGRVCVGIERYEPYYNIAIKRAREDGKMFWKVP